MLRKLRLILVCFLIGWTSALGQTPITQEQLKERVLERLDGLVGLLNRQAGQRTALAEVLNSTQLQVSNSILSQMQHRNLDMAYVGPTNEQNPSKGGGIPTSSQMHDTISNLQNRSQILAEYANTLKNLRNSIAASPPQQVLSKLQGISVPKSMVNIVFDPLGERLPVGNQPAQPAGLTDLTPFIVGSGDASVDFPTVGAVLYRNSQSDLATGCTATLIAANAALTAAHCLNLIGTDKQVHKPIDVFFQHAGMIHVSTAIPPLPSPFYTGSDFADVGIIFFDSPITGITPVAFNSTAQLPTGSVTRIVGFGYHSLFNALQSTGEIIDKSGIKVWAHIMTEKCKAGKSIICWTYKQRPVDEVFGSSCYGDSGGPLFARIANRWVLAGVTRGSTSNKPCQPNDTAIDVEVFDFAGWITKQLKAHLSASSVTSLQPLQPLDNDADSRYVVQISDSIFQPADPTFSKMFSLGPKVTIVRVAINATPRDVGVSTGLELTVAQTGKEAICVVKIDDTTASCDLHGPPGGDWTVSVSGAPGQEFQVVATLFSS